jgi:chemotaxis protein methyltransferase CheR
MSIELGIVDIRAIIKAVQHKYDYDLSIYALTSLKQRLEKIIDRNNLVSADNLIKKINNNPDFFDLFLYELNVPSSEMFRDPSLWRWLREDYFVNGIDTSKGTFRIWFPNCVSGGELFSLTILLNEMDLLDKVQILASSMSDKAIEYISKGHYDLKKIEVSGENYVRFNGEKDFTNYYKLDRYTVARNTDLIKNVEFSKQRMDLDNPPRNVKMIMFRNNLIYYNPSYQDALLKKLHGILSAAGIIILGAKEKIRSIGSSGIFDLVNESECVYKKKIT